MKNNYLKNSLLFFAMVCSFAGAIEVDSPAVRALQEEINGGPERPVQLYVREYKNAYIVEGAVDRKIERDFATKSCQLAAGYKDLYKQRGFKSAEDMCVIRVRIRPGAPLDPPSTLRVVYKLIFIPDSALGVDQLMNAEYSVISGFNKNSILLTSVAIDALDSDEVIDSAYAELTTSSYAMGRAPASEVPVEKLVTESKEVLPPNSDAKELLDSGLKHLFTTKTNAFSIPGTDKIVVSSDVALSGIDAHNAPVMSIKSQYSLSNQTPRVVGAITKIVGKKVPALVLVVLATKIR